MSDKLTVTSLLDVGDTCPKCGGYMEYADYDERGGHIACQQCGHVEGDIESRLSNPIEDAGTRSHYDLNQSIASLLKESGPTWKGDKKSRSCPECGEETDEPGDGPCTVCREGKDKKASKSKTSLLKEERQLSVPEKHQLQIAKKTLQMNDTFARIMGGMTKDEAREIIKRLTGREFKESKTAIQNITYGIDMESGVIVSRMGSEIAWPIMEYEKIGEKDDFTRPLTYKLEKFDLISIAGHIYDNIKWTKNVPVDEKNKHREFWGMPSLGAGQAMPDMKQGEQVETRASILKTETKNEDVIHIFLSDTFPKDMNKNWGTGNLKIVKEPDGWSLVNYWTRILYRGVGGKVYFNTKKYSQTTSVIQREIERIARELSVKLIPVEDDSLDESIKTDTTPESSPVETTPENPPLEEPTSGDALWTGRYEPGIGGDLEEPGQHVTVTNASLLKESGLEEFSRPSEITMGARVRISNTAQQLRGETGVVVRKTMGFARKSKGETMYEVKLDNYKSTALFYSEDLIVEAGIMTSSSLLKESGLENHAMEVLTAAGVAHLVEWEDGKLRLVKKEMGSGDEFADEVIKALGNTGAFGTVTYNAENNQFNFGIYGEPKEVTIVSVLK